jgi:multidrug efflux pump subunit AcrB
MGHFDVSQASRRRAKGKTLCEAALEAGARRFRPILLTSVTTFAGLAPLMVFQRTYEKAIRTAEEPLPLALPSGIDQP